jgi:hypothetical protein
MARTQTLMWTVLPNGVYLGSDGSKVLRASVFVSPRLQLDIGDPLGGTPLGYWADFMKDASANWAASAKELKFRVEVASSSALSAVTTIDSSKVKVLTTPEPALWAKFFKIETLVKRYEFDDIGQMKLASFSQAAMYASLKKLYSYTATQPGVVSASAFPLPETLLKPPGSRSSMLMASLPPEERPQSLGVRVSAQAEQLWADFNRFSQPFPRNARLSAQAQAVPVLDFHALIGSLANYPALLRRLGLIVDLEFPLSSDVESKDRVRVTPEWPDGVHKPGTPDMSIALTHQDGSPWTAYVCQSSAAGVGPRFEAKPKDPTRMRHGMMVLRDAGNDPDKDLTAVINVDVQNAAMRAQALAASAAAAVRKAEAQGIQLPRKGYLALEDPAEGMALPALGHASLGVSVKDQKEQVQKSIEESKSKNEQLSSSQFAAIVNWAEDVTRGYRVDVWDNATSKWRSLCRRSTTYRIGNDVITWPGNRTALLDEGWVQLGTLSAVGVDPQNPGSGKQADINVTDSLFTWTGWSLVVPRPGKALLDGIETKLAREYTTVVDGRAVTYPLGDYGYKYMPLSLEMAVPAGSLPRMRFGYTYQFRARAVDLAGNSITTSDLSATSGRLRALAEDVTVASRPIENRRFDPVKPPIVHIVEAMKLRESPLEVVIRSNYDKPPAEKGKRHMFPPRSSVAMAELQGAFDKSTGPVDSSSSTHKFVSTLDKYDFPMDSNREQKPLASIPARPPYIPEIQSRGAALVGLPGVKAVASPISLGGVWDPKIQTFQVRAAYGTARVNITSLKVPFEKPLGAWFDRAPFTLVVQGIEGADARLLKRGTPGTPKWNARTRQLTVQLPKGEAAEIRSSSYVDIHDLNVMGVFDWATNATSGATAEQLKYTGLLGMNWTITPNEKINLVHAVQQPLIAPAWTRYTRVLREEGETHATLVDWVDVHGKSTQRLDVNAAWSENVDDLADSAPRWGATAVKRSGIAFDLTLAPTDTMAMDAGKASPRRSAVPLVSQKVDPKMQRHFFGDTKHRKVSYQLIATSRFADYFAAGAVVTRSSAEKTLHIVSSARPDLPKIAYAVPSFEWSHNPESSTRRGGRVRVYLERPWFSSGDNEQLGVVLYGGSSWAQVRHFVSEWGADPLFSAYGRLTAENLAPEHFPVDASRKKKNLHIPDYPAASVSVVGFDVDYDDELGLWFADVAIDPGSTYFPFVKLALARYQPYSLSGLELSSVVTMECVQLAPERSATLSKSEDSAKISVSGPTYRGGSSATTAKASVVEAVVQGRAGGDDIAWVPVGSTALLAWKGASGGTGTWSGSVPIPTQRSGYEYRILVQEYEIWSEDFDSTQPARRLVYADVLPLGS